MPHLACCRRGASRGACGCGRMPYRGPQAAQDTAEAQAGGATEAHARGLQGPSAACTRVDRDRKKKTHRHTQTHTHRDTHTQTHTHRDTHTAPAASSGHAGVGWGGEAQTIFDTSRMLFHFCTSHPVAPIVSLTIAQYALPQGPSHIFRSHVLVAVYMAMAISISFLSSSLISESTEQRIQPPVKCERSGGGRGCMQ